MYITKYRSIEILKIVGFLIIIIAKDTVLRKFNSQVIRTETFKANMF